MVGSLTERERHYGSLKTCKITCEDLYGKLLECDWGTKPLSSLQILLLSNVHKKIACKFIFNIVFISDNIMHYQESACS